MAKLISVIFIWSLIILFIYGCFYWNKKNNQPQVNTIYVDQNKDTLIIKIIRK